MGHSWKIQNTGVLGCGGGNGNPIQKYSSILAWRVPWTEEPGRVHGVSKSLTWLSMLGIYLSQLAATTATAVTSAEMSAPRVNVGYGSYVKSQAALGEHMWLLNVQFPGLSHNPPHGSPTSSAASQLTAPAPLLTQNISQFMGHPSPHLKGAHKQLSLDTPRHDSPLQGLSSGPYRCIHPNVKRPPRCRQHPHPARLKLSSPTSILAP